MYESIIQQVIVNTGRINKYTPKANSEYSEIKGLMSDLVKSACENDVRLSDDYLRVEIKEYKNKIYLAIHTSTIGGKRVIRYIEINATVKDETFDLEQEIAYDHELQEMQCQIKELERQRAEIMYKMNQEIQKERGKKHQRKLQIKREKEDKKLYR